MEAALGIVAFLALVVIAVALLRGPDDPEVEELPGLVAGNWPTIEDDLRGDGRPANDP